jgi:hypothetical protein
MMSQKIVSILLNFLLTSLFAVGQTQIGEDIDGERTGDQSGWSVSMSADASVVAIGARTNDGNGTNSGHTRVFQYQENNWVQLGEDIDGENQGDASGWAVSLSSDGKVVAIGAMSNDDNGTSSGHTRIFQYISDSWVQMGEDIDGVAALDHSGASVSLSADGQIVAIGATGNDSNGLNSGHVQIFKFSNQGWTQLGGDIFGDNAEDAFGISVSLSSDGMIVAVGANGNDSNGDNSGHSKVFEYASGSWNQKGGDIHGEHEGDKSGYRLSLSDDGNVISIGAIYNDDNGNSSGHVRAYKFDSNSWIQMGSDIDGEKAEDRSGGAVSLSGDGTVLAIGATGNDGNSLGKGHTRIYKFVQDSWVQIGPDIDGEKGDDYSGISVSLSENGKVLAIGAHGNDGNQSNSGHVRVFELDDVLSIQQLNITRPLIIYPNPCMGTEEINIEVDLNFLGLPYEILDHTGRHVKAGTLNISPTTTQLNGLSSGIYFIRVESMSNLFKLIVN